MSDFPFVTFLAALPGEGAGGVLAGFAHPFSSWDHSLAMIAVGIWAAQLGKGARWFVPGVFLSAMVSGAALGATGTAAPGIQSSVLVTVLLLGLLVAGAVRMPLLLGLPVIAVCALFHGLSHGAGASAGAGGLDVPFFVGFLVATGLLHVGGMWFAWVAAKARSPHVLRWAGAGIAAASVALWVR